MSEQATSAPIPDNYIKMLQSLKGKAEYEPRLKVFCSEFMVEVEFVRAWLKENT